MQNSCVFSRLLSDFTVAVSLATAFLAACGGDNSPSTPAMSTDTAALLASANKVKVPTKYKLTDLGTLGGTDSVATGINDAGQVVGTSLTASNVHHATIWNGTTARDLGTLGGTESFANAVNKVGEVVGSSFTAAGVEHAFIWNGTSITDLGTLGSLSGNFSEASRINKSGQVV